jgi:NAD(P)-dependent dehydrogenase (short-subunit alcohol dehydrogenase family)
MTGSKTGKVMLITGGSRGIGAATARLAVKHGYRVVVNYVSDRAAAEVLCEDIRIDGGMALAFQGDMGKLDDIERLFKQTILSFGQIDVVVNNAGVTGKSGRLDQTDPKLIADVIAVNTTGAIYVAREAVKHMSTRNGGKGGVIVNISSAAALLGSPGEYVWYAASKGAIDSLTIGLAKEVALENVRVVSVTPGMIETEIHDKSSGDPARVERIRPGIPMQRIGKADDIAEAVLFLASDAANYITGTTLRVSGGR